MDIRRGDFSDSRIVDLLRHHVASARAATAPGSSHALDLAGLQTADIAFWSLWDGDTLVGIAALKQIAPDHGEVKSMHVAQAHRGRGAGGRLVAHLVAAARADGLRRLSLETGTWPYFAPARALYARHGFVECGPFAGYVEDPNSAFMTLDLTEDTPARPG